MMCNKNEILKFVPSEDDLSNGLDFLWYELAQFCMCVDNLNQNSDAIDNAVLESLLIHTRQLLDFFEHSNRSTYWNKRIKKENNHDFGWVSKS